MYFFEFETWQGFLEVGCSQSPMSSDGDKSGCRERRMSTLDTSIFDSRTRSLLGVGSVLCVLCRLRFVRNVSLPDFSRIFCLSP